MKNNVILLGLLLLSLTGIAQNGKNYNQFSIEGAYVMSIPFAATVAYSGLSDANFNSFGGFNLGARYMFDREWGVKGEVAYNGYHGEDHFGTNFTRLDAQAVYNLGQLMDLPLLTNETVGLLAHSGFGVTWAKSLYNNSLEHTGNFIIGVTPLFKISDQFVLTTDISYLVNFKQHNHYDGVPFDPPTVKYETGQSINFSFGFIYYLGQAKMHADWY